MRIDGKVLSPSHYSLSYANATQVGTATVTAKGLGDFKNLNVSTTYKITKASQTISVKVATASVYASSTKNHACSARCISKVTGKKSALYYKKASGSGNLSINSSTGLVNVNKGTKAGTYKIRVSIYAKASTNYKKSNTVTKTLTVKVK